MDDLTTDQGAGAAPKSPNLTLAVRRARIDAAQHTDALAELRGAENARLEMLGDALKPVMSQVPAHIDLFDTGLAHGEKPRYFIDMLAFVEMARDRRTYRFLQDTRHGRVTVLESERLEAIVESVTGYVARRLVEREQALASDRTIEDAARALIASGAADVAGPVADQTNMAATIPSPEISPPRRGRGLFVKSLLFTIELLGSIVLFAALLGIGYFLWTVGMHQWALWRQG